MKSMRVILLLVVSLLVTCQASAQSVSFQAAVNYSTGTNPVAVAVGDFNQDGNPDLAIALLLDDGSVSVLLGKNDGTFEAAVTYGGLGQGPASAVAADLNGDGKLDLVVANVDGSSVSVLLGKGDGSFQTAMNFNTGAGTAPFSVGVGDFDGDGNLDAAAADFANNSVVVLTGNGGGNLHLTSHPWFVGTNPISIAVGDFNNDGRPDLAVANEGSNDVSVLLGNGSATFQPMVSYSAGTGPHSVVVGDFNGDGQPDLAVANSESNDVSVLLGNSDGTFQPAASYAAGAGARSIALGDFNGDANLDLAVANFYGSVSVLLGNGNGTFQSAVNFGAGTNPSSIAVGDFNGDGKPDLAVTDSATGNVSILLNTTGSKTATSTQLSSSVNPSIFGQSVTLTATISSSQGVPTGSVTFYDSGTALSMQSLSNGVAMLITSSLSVGLHSLTATYDGDASHTGSTSPVLNQLVNQATTTTAATSSPNPSLATQSVVFTATIASAFGGTPTGTVTFKAGSDTLGTAMVSGGQATLNFAFPTPGTRSVTATYSGDPNFLSSSSIPFNQVVNTAATTTTLTSSLNPSTYGQAVTFTATVSSAVGAPPNGENLTFQDGLFTLGNATLSSGVATFTTSALIVFPHSIKATYGGDANFAASSSALLNQVVKKAGTTTLLVSSQNPSKKGKSVTFTVTVIGQFGGAPTGLVTLTDGNQFLGLAIVLNGQATFSTSSLTKGPHVISATYSGLINFSASSGSLTQVVN